MRGTLIVHFASILLFLHLNCGNILAHPASNSSGLSSNVMNDKSLTITEVDEAGNVTATYVQSAGSQAGDVRIDKIVSIEWPNSTISHDTL